MQDIFKVIKESFSLLYLEEDWDSDGAEKCNVAAFNKAMIFIHLLISKVENIIPPFICSCKDGSIDISFERGNKYNLLINITPAAAVCYGDDGNNGDVIKNDDLKMDDVIKWCSKNLTTVLTIK